MFNLFATRTLRIESLEERRLLAVTLQDLQDAGISQAAIDVINNSGFVSQILSEATLENTIAALNSTQSAPANATVLTSEAQFSQIQNGGTYLIQGDLTVTGTLEVPSNATIYVDGSIFKQGSFVRTPGGPLTENSSDAIFRISGSDNVRLIGLNNALLHSNPNLSKFVPHATAVYVHQNADNIEVEGFEIANVWEGVVGRSLQIDNMLVTNNYIHDTVNRAIWSLGPSGFEAAHNFIENAGLDSLDFDAFTDGALSYENVSIGAGRFAGFVEEGTQDSFFIRGLAIMVDMGNPNRGFQLGWASAGTTAFFGANNPGLLTADNYFIDNVIYEPFSFSTGGSDYYANSNDAGKGITYFWANRAFGAEIISATLDDHVEVLSAVPTIGGKSGTVNGVQLLNQLNLEHNGVPLPPIAAGDFDNNVFIDDSDLSIWQGAFGLNAGGDDNGDGLSNGADFLSWQRNYNPRPLTPNAFIEANGEVVFEAEHPTKSDDGGFRTFNTPLWQAVRAPLGSGGAAVNTTNTGVITQFTEEGVQYDSNTGTRLDYDIEFSTPGTYRVFVRTLGASTNDDSIHVGFEGYPISLGNGTGLGDSSGNWVWVDDVTGGLQNITITVDHPGVHTFNIWMREDGTQVDKIVLNTSGIVPVGFGPTESARVPGPLSALVQTTTDELLPPSELTIIDSAIAAPASPATELAGLAFSADDYQTSQDSSTTRPLPVAEQPPLAVESFSAESTLLQTKATGSESSSPKSTSENQPADEAAFEVAFQQFQPLEFLL